MTSGRDLRPGLMSGMLSMQRRNLTAAPLRDNAAKTASQRREKRKRKKTKQAVLAKQSRGTSMRRGTLELMLMNGGQ